MSKETGTLIIKQVRPRYETPNTATSSLDRPAPKYIGFDWLVVKCKPCGEEWKATQDIHLEPGKFVEVSGQLLLTCPSCGLNHSIPAKLVYEA